MHDFIGQFIPLRHYKVVPLDFIANYSDGYVDRCSYAKRMKSILYSALTGRRERLVGETISICRIKDLELNSEN